MKKTFLILTVVLSVAMTFTGCKKDEDDPESYLKAGEDKYILAGGDVFFKGTTQTNLDMYDYSISLFSDGLTYVSWNGYNPSYNGTGTLILFHLKTSGAAKPDDGVYTLTLSEGNSCTGGGYEIDFSTAWDEVKEFDTGTLTLSISGETYTLNFEGTDEYDNPVELFFKGTLTFHDESQLL